MTAPGVVVDFQKKAREIVGSVDSCCHYTREKVEAAIIAGLEAAALRAKESR